MRKRDKEMTQRAVMYLVAGVAAWFLVQEIPAMVRYYKMKRL
jgi:hypothetical protein